MTKEFQQAKEAEIAEMLDSMHLHRLDSEALDVIRAFNRAIDWYEQMCKKEAYDDEGRVIKIYQTSDHISIEIAKKDLVSLAQTHNEWPLKVLDEQKFIEAVMFQIRNYQESNERELGVSYIENAVDKMIIQVGEDANPSVEPKYQE